MRSLQLRVSGPGVKDIHSLPDDVLLLIISYITVKDIITLRKSSKKFYALTKLRWVWSDAVKRHVIDRGLPVPAEAATPGIKTLSSQHLEARAVHAAKFNDNWYSTHPKPRGAIEFTVSTDVDTDPPHDNGIGPTWLREVLFLRGRCGEFLVTLAANVIECWEVPLDGSGAYRIAVWQAEHGIEQLLVNNDPKHAAEVAYLSYDVADPSSAWVYTLALDTFHGAFKPLSAMRGAKAQIAPLHTVHGDFIVMGDPLLVWNTAGPAGTKSVARMRADAHLDTDKILAVKAVGTNIVVVRTGCVECYVMPVWSVEDMRFSSLGYIISALAMESDPIREAAIVIRPKDMFAVSSAAQSSTPPVSVMLLHSTHTLTQLELLPCTLSKDHALHGPYEMPGDPARIYQVAPSAGRLKVSSGGKGIWLQTHNVTMRHAKYPARCVMGFDISSPHQIPPPKPPRQNHCEVLLLKDAPEDCHDISHLHICERELYARRCNMGEILRRKYAITSADLEDSVGRIAVGDRWGKVEILDYV